MQPAHRASLEDKRDKANTAYRLSFYPLLLLYIILGLPLVGNFAYIAVHEVIGSDCPPATGSKPVDCFRNGVNIGQLQYNYAMATLALGLPNPLLAFRAVIAIVPPWLLLPWVLAVVISYCLKSWYDDKLSQRHT